MCYRGTILCVAGVQGFSLSSSPSSEDGHISVCPATTVTLTCIASGVMSLGWRDQNRPIASFIDSDSGSSETVYSYTVTVVAVDNGDGTANFTSTLEVMVDNITNGTNISCEIFRNQKHLVIYIAS